MNKVTAVMAQLNPHLGNLEQNLQAHLQAIENAKNTLHADVIIFPELSLTGYPPEDLLLRSHFIKRCEQTLQELAKSAQGIHVIAGHPSLAGNKLYNSCSVLHDGKVTNTYSKLLLPNYGVFDECRYFTCKDQAVTFKVNGINFGIVICEDAWDVGPIENSVAAGAEVILSPNASPFTADKHEIRCKVFSERMNKNNVPLLYVNQVCGQDDLVFDGGSMVFNQHGKPSHFAGFFKESLTPVVIEKTDAQIEILPPNNTLSIPGKLERIYQALCLGLRDYINKNNLPGVIIGLSGGIDSALTCTIAVDALGKDKVHGVKMPSRYTADISNDDADELAKNLNITCSNLPIEQTYQSFLETLSGEFKDKPTDVTEENIQARCRGVLLMALSNASGKLVLPTGNRSEIAVGYCTLYGDMSGGYSVLKDVPKTMVYELANYRNTQSKAIPQRTISRAPSAELAPNQTDQDSLPPYDVLDGILHCYLNKGMDGNSIAVEGYDPETVDRVIKLIKRNEYKRKQAAIGPRINKTSFNRDWRYPNTNGFKD